MSGQKSNTLLFLRKWLESGKKWLESSKILLMSTTLFIYENIKNGLRH